MNNNLPSMASLVQLYALVCVRGADVKAKRMARAMKGFSHEDDTWEPAGS